MNCQGTSVSHETGVLLWAKALYHKLEGCAIPLNYFALTIDLDKKIILTDRDTYCYSTLYNSIPIPELPNLIKASDEEYGTFCNAAKKLHWTSGYLVSLGLKGDIPREELWEYVYDEDVIISRLYSPSLMSEFSAPKGCYSIQAEIYIRDGRQMAKEDEILKEAIRQLDKIGVISKDDIIVRDIRFVKYCNVIFDHEIYRNRELVDDYLKQKEVISIGRFGKWDYLWSDQSFVSGYNAV